MMKHTVTHSKASKRQQQSASELMARALIKGNIAPSFLHCTELLQYVKVVSAGTYAGLTRPIYNGILKDLESSAASLISTNISRKL
jgi:uncharacterized protein HemY